MKREIYTRGKVRLQCGDCREVMAELPDWTFTGVITDPPYELGFMGKKWDRSGIAFNVTMWREVLRICKPGAPLFAFGGSRTWHRLACAIEDAGWIIRDCIADLYALEPLVSELSEGMDPGQREMLSALVDQLTGQRGRLWLYGNGMPKGQAIGKAIDKAAGAEREVVGKTIYAGGHIQRSGAPSHYGDAPASSDTRYITLPATPAAATWEGWNTTLAPAFEPIICAMKPLDGTFVENALEHVVAGINVEGCRVETAGTRQIMVAASHKQESSQRGIGFQLGTISRGRKSIVSNIGRWPANVLLDSDVAARLNEVVGERKPGHTYGGDRRNREVYGMRRLKPGGGYYDYGGPSRFFPTVDRFKYNSKATAKDRGHRTEKALPLFDGNDAVDREVRCKHPTVKPTAVCEWLVKLASMPDGTHIIDPFSGTGQIAKACLRLGVGCLGIEIDKKTHEWAVGLLRRENAP